MTSKGHCVLVDVWSQHHITNIQRHSDTQLKTVVSLLFMQSPSFWFINVGKQT